MSTITICEICRGVYSESNDHRKCLHEAMSREPEPSSILKVLNQIVLELREINKSLDSLNQRE